IFLFTVDSGCSKHMTGNLKLLINFVEKFLGTVKFGNNQIAPILGYGDLALHAYFAVEGILHQMSVARTPEQNGAKAIATTCFTQNCSLVIPRHEKTPYHIINDRKPSVKFFHIFGSFCYIVGDGENLDKMKEKGDACIFVGYSTQSRAYRVFNRRTRVIVETIHVNFDELLQMASDHVSSDPAPECQRMALEHDSLSPGLQCQENVTQADKTVTTSNELDLLFNPMFDEMLNGSSKVVSKSSVVSTADAPIQRQQHTTPLNTHTSPAPTCQVPTQVPSVASPENMNQAEMVDECVSLCQTLHCLLILLQLVEIVLFIVDSGCSKHMTGNLKLLINFMEKFMGTVIFGNDQIAPILGYGDLVQGAVTIKRVYYVEGLSHNLFSVGQFCDADLEVAFQKSTCFIRDLKGNDLLTGSRGTNLYSITLQDKNSPNLICLMAKATSSQAWLWHRRLSHLNFDTINLLSKNDIVVGLPKLKFFKDHLCSSCELGKSKRKLVQRGLQAQVRIVRTDKDTKFLNQNLHAYFAVEGIHHQTSVAQTPEQNGIVERRNRTLVEAARTMLSAAKVPLFFWAEAIATACFTQNRSLLISRHEKTP
nr:integrase, catalytic region, zinc finger, CCHC-type, peptidase aspartic, catalytic [Tanacetum cinerariifolium]